MKRKLVLLIFAVLIGAGALYQKQVRAIAALALYTLNPDVADFRDGEEIVVPGLSTAVTVKVADTGIANIDAATEMDVFRAVGYLHARERMFQMNLLRHVGRGEVAALLGNVSNGNKMTIHMDMFNRGLGIAERAQNMYDGLTPFYRELLAAYTSGVNAWIETGPEPLEHRLIDYKMEPWTGQDTLVVFHLITFGLSHNYTRELSRLLVACDAGVGSVDRIWPGIEFGPFALPGEFLAYETSSTLPEIADEMRRELDGLCPETNQMALDADIELQVATNYPFGGDDIALPIADLMQGLQASNNWAISGTKTESGRVQVANDPHLNHMKPSLVWAVRYKLRDQDLDVAGFMIPGLPFVLFGHNRSVAWSETVNNVDIQDLFVLKPTADGQGYLVDGEEVPFEVKTHVFDVAGGEPIHKRIRYTRYGPVLNDIMPMVADAIPLAALQTVEMAKPGDIFGFHKISQSKSVEDFFRKSSPIDLICLSWVVGDREGNIGYTSPCAIPKRDHLLGTFPAPGWQSKYDWQGYYEKDVLPQALNPKRGWVASGNNRIIPQRNFPSAYNNDASPPNRYVEIAETMAGRNGFTKKDSQALQVHTGIRLWADVRAELRDFLCEDSGATLFDRVRRQLCHWDGNHDSDSEAATVFQLWTNEMLDLTIPDEFVDGQDSIAWAYMQSIIHFEANVHRLWMLPNEDLVWDDVRTGDRETKQIILQNALRAAVDRGQEKYGDDLTQWAWGSVRPFYVKHVFGNQSPLLGKIFHSKTVPGSGAPESVLKAHFTRDDREHMHPGRGAVMRSYVDFGDPALAWYALAGGQSGWPMTKHYDDILDYWAQGEYVRLRLLEGETPAATFTIKP